MSKKLTYLLILLSIFISYCTSFEKEKDNIFSSGSLKKMPVKSVKINYSDKEILSEIIERQSNFRPIENIISIKSINITKVKSVEQKSNCNFTLKTRFINVPFENKIFTCKNKYFSINFDNDIFNNTDFYYTNGINFEFINHIFEHSPLMKLMLPYRGSSINYYGISLVQNMYTPTNPDIEYILIGDRPFSAYLYIGHFKISNDVIKKFRQTSELNIGLIGSNALGGLVQQTIHDIEPHGWNHQISNDIVLNYSVKFEKSLLSSKIIEVNGMLDGSVGTLYNKIGLGFLTRMGKFNPYFNGISYCDEYSRKKDNFRKIRYYFFAKVQSYLIGYDATLQGGVFNRSSIYTIDNKNINRTVFKGSAGVVFSLSRFSLEVEQVFLTPEFNTGLFHKWLHINTRFCF
jgi:hypothetical protein